jgi:deoxyribodipyrimidine photo-lyase
VSKKYIKSLFVFRRDYRLEDNTALIKACEDSQEVIPVFCFDPAQYDKQQNDYFGENSFRFLIESLRELYEELQKKGSKLHFLQGLPWEEIPRLAVEQKCAAVYFNNDYTPYVLQRDANIKTVIDSKEIDLVTFADVLLTAPGSVATNDGQPYKVFTPFKRKAINQTVAKPAKFSAANLITTQSGLLANKTILSDLDPGGNSSRQIGGRSHGLNKLAQLKDLTDYRANRHYPGEISTSEISGHLTFGTLSIREVYWHAIEVFGSPTSKYITELYWRDFYLHLLYAFPYVLGDEFQEKYQGMDWAGVETSNVSKDELLERWQQGMTGFPIIDAGMRQLLRDGWMHNRVRMIVASFLTKDLHLDWRDGERWFANHLVDYDPANNNGGWQWAASTGADSAPYFRIFNPWTQQEKFDKNCLYIKKYIPELKDVECKVLHKLGEMSDEELDIALEGTNYPKPIVSHKEEREVAIKHYKSLG